MATRRISKLLDQLSSNECSNEALSCNSIILNDGCVIPQIGLGTWMNRMGMKSYIDKSKLTQKEIEQSVKEDEEDYQEFANAITYAIKYGYRHIDTAQLYRTEKVIGDVIKNISNIDPSLTRKDIFITTKVARMIRDPKQVRASIERSLNDLQTYVDLFLIHSPHSQSPIGQRGQDTIQVYKILLEYQKQGKIRSVGVSNFGIKHLKIMERLGLALPSVNQIEVSCFLYEKELIEYCDKKGIIIEAYTPLAKADERVKRNKLINELGKKYDKTWAQIMIKWCQQQGMVVLVKSTNEKRIKQNGDVFDFKIDEFDMKRLKTLNAKNIRKCWNPMKDVVWDL